MSVLTPHQSKALNIDRSTSLTANAGSGKTFVLAQRFLEIIINTSTPLNQIAAITFTEKAAGELYRRISNELNKLSLITTDEGLRNRMGKIRKQLVSAKISTIHSFCIDLLKEFPVEASLDANFIPINENKASELIDLSIENTLREMLRDINQQSDVKLLIRLLGSKANLIRELLEMIRRRKNVFHLLGKYYSLSEDKIVKLQFELFKSSVKVVFEKELPEVLTQLEVVNNKVLENNSKNELAINTKIFLEALQSSTDVVNTLMKLKELRDKILTTDGSVRKKSYLVSQQRDKIQNSVDVVEQFFSELDEIGLIENHESIEKELIRYNLALIRVFQYVLSTYENKKSEIGVLDFEDILLKAKTLLENESVRKSLSCKYKFLLVDEYQDTNEIQYEIFLPLVDELKRGNLFIVGDEKQSIYRFRDAELQVFSRTKTDIQQLYGNHSLLTLPDSFRMAPAICFFVNSLFKNLFKEPRLFFNEVPASDLVCARSDNFWGQVEFLIAKAEEDNEAELVAKRIIRLKQEQKERLKNWSEIAVLVRKRASFAELQNAFIKYQIPFNLVGGTGFYQQQSINDIYNYFAFLLNDKDDAALIGILRSPFFFVSDVKIFELSMFEGESFWEKIKSASAPKNKVWRKIFEILNENKKLSNRISISLLLRKILKETDFFSTLASRIDGVQEISNLNKLISITNDFVNNEFNTLYDYVNFLSESISGIEDEAHGRIERGRAGVNILTIHQAKGLEYPAVFLYKCNDTTQINKVKARSFTVDKDFGLLTKVPVNENYFGKYHSAPVVGLYNLIESKKETAELKRLLYVGLTRAKDFLFISQTDEGKSAKKNSFTALINEGLNQDLNNLQINLDGELTYLQKRKDIFENLTKPIKLVIPIVRNIESSEKLIEAEEFDMSYKKMRLSEVNDHSRGEVISATRFSTFSSCPLKYNLLYNYKLGDLIQLSFRFQNTSKFSIQEDYSRNELASYLFDDDSRVAEFAKFRGQLIHYALRKNISRESVPTFVDANLKNNFSEEVTALLSKEIISDLFMFLDSDEFRLINSFPKYHNEFEAYLKEGDYFLFGILDKLIIADKKLIIVDYKTDRIDKNEFSAIAEKYLPQLKFYAYIISRLFKKKQDIEGRIIFTKFPEDPFIFRYDETSDKSIKSKINLMINSIRSNNYPVNLNACKYCIFADENSQCINTKSETSAHSLSSKQVYKNE
ncbi:MAG: UvrD-helicase domain-containing protein [Ignavibacteriaceae bacterium]|nr:UvrD-helicase domain-containing protein [Ignavibacteriaceae bacterium]